MPFTKGEIPEGATPFQPGQSGNPAGRPPGIPNTATRLRRWLELITKVKNPVTGVEEPATLLEMMDAVIIKKALKGDLKSYQEIIDRMEGSAKQNHEIELGENTLNSPLRVIFTDLSKKDDEPSAE